MTKIILSLAAFFVSLTAQATCTVGEMTQLKAPLAIVPCGKFDPVKKVCTDLTPTSLNVGTPVHITKVEGAKAEVFIGMIQTAQGERYINKFAMIDMGSKTQKNLSCQE